MKEVCLPPDTDHLVTIRNRIFESETPILFPTDGNTLLLAIGFIRDITASDGASDIIAKPATARERTLLQIAECLAIYGCWALNQNVRVKTGDGCIDVLKYGPSGLESRHSFVDLKYAANYAQKLVGEEARG